MEAPPIQYARTSDGVRIAYSVFGGGDALPVLMVYAIPGGEAVGIMSTGGFGAMAVEIAVDRPVAIMTRRGVGSSQRGVLDVSLEHLALDVDAVADRLGFERFAIWSIGSGALVALHYAATRPGRVAALVMDSPSATRGATDNALEYLIQSDIDWELVSELFPVIVTGRAKLTGGALGLPAFFRRSHNRDDLRRQLDAIADVDLRPVLPGIKAPTLITISDVAERQNRIEGVHDVAAGIPEALLVAVESQFGTEAGREFLRRLEGPSVAPAAPPPGVRAPEAGAFRAILFTDLAAHTEMMDSLGDEAGRQILREHERITREALAEHGGAEVKTLGDGFMASFSSVSQSLKCAQALQRAFEKPLESGYRLNVRIGINAGEPIEEDDDLFGTSVIVAARTAASAGGAQIVVTDVVRQLVAGKEFLFADRGLSTLKGFEDPVRTWEVLW